MLYVSTATTLQNKRNLPVLCQGFCVHSAVNSICFKVWTVLQDWNGQVASQASHINSKSKSLAHSPQSQRPTPTSASFSLHTGINQELESRPQRWKQLQKIHPASEVARRYKTDFISQVVRCRAASRLDSRKKTCLKPVCPCLSKGAPGHPVLCFLVPHTGTSTWGEGMKSTGSLILWLPCTPRSDPQDERQHQLKAVCFNGATCASARI